jgi:hypothetical protein
VLCAWSLTTLEVVISLLLIAHGSHRVLLLQDTCQGRDKWQVSQSEQCAQEPDLP